MAEKKNTVVATDNVAPTDKVEDMTTNVEVAPTDKVEDTTTNVEVAPTDKVEEIVNLMLSIDNLEDAMRLCQIINVQQPILYNLVMGGVPPRQPNL